MTTLLIPITTYLIIVFAIAVALTGVFAWLQYRASLEEFRANLRPGQMVRLLRPDGTTVRARIMVKESDRHFVAIDIDTKTKHITASDFIFEP